MPRKINNLKIRPWKTKYMNVKRDLSTLIKDNKIISIVSLPYILFAMIRRTFFRLISITQVCWKSYKPRITGYLLEFKSAWKQICITVSFSWMCTLSIKSFSTKVFETESFGLLPWTGLGQDQCPFFWRHLSQLHQNHWSFENWIWMKWCRELLWTTFNFDIIMIISNLHNRPFNNCIVFL